jgi:hypothetical protein
MAKNLPQNHKLCVCVCVCFLFHFLKKKFQFRKIPKKKKTPHLDSKHGDFFWKFQHCFFRKWEYVTIYSLFYFNFSYFCEIWHPTKKSCTHYHLFLFSFMDCSDPSVIVWISDMMLVKSFILQWDEKTVTNNLFH